MNENSSARGRRHLRFSLKLAAGLVGAALLLALGRAQGWIDGETVVRAYNVIMGLGFAAYGNALPKMMHHLPPRSIHEATLAQAVARVASWAMTLGFLAWAAFWAFAPRDLALVGSLAAVGASVAVMLGFAVWKFAASRASRSD